MANNKVVLSDGTIIIDLSQDTVTSASHILEGCVGHLANGTQVTGTANGAYYADYESAFTALGADDESVGETSTPLTDSINALTTYSNAVTSASDPDLSSAVATLASGYGGGGGMREVSVAVESNASYGTFNEFASRYIVSNADATYYICFVIFENNGSATRAGISALYYKTPTGSQVQINRVGALAKDVAYGCDIISGATIHLYYLLEDDAIWTDYYTA